MASASSFPANHFTMTLDAVIPVISAPIPKIANPKEANATCMSIPKSCASPKSEERAYHLIRAPININPEDIIPVKRIPILSKITPPKNSISKNTLIKP
jgi:hypothetical protein